MVLVLRSLFIWFALCHVAVINASISFAETSSFVETLFDNANKKEDANAALNDIIKHVAETINFSSSDHLGDTSGNGKGNFASDMHYKYENIAEIRFVRKSAFHTQDAAGTAKVAFLQDCIMVPRETDAPTCPTNVHLVRVIALEDFRGETKISSYDTFVLTPIEVMRAQASCSLNYRDLPKVGAAEHDGERLDRLALFFQDAFSNRETAHKKLHFHLDDDVETTTSFSKRSLKGISDHIDFFKKYASDEKKSGISPDLKLEYSGNQHEHIIFRTVVITKKREGVYTNKILVIITVDDKSGKFKKIRIFDEPLSKQVAHACPNEAKDVSCEM